MALRDLLDMVESWLMDDCPVEAREDYRAQLHRPVLKVDKQTARRSEVISAAMAMGGEIG